MGGTIPKRVGVDFQQADVSAAFERLVLESMVSLLVADCVKESSELLHCVIAEGCVKGRLNCLWRGHGELMRGRRLRHAVSTQQSRAHLLHCVQPNQRSIEHVQWRKNQCEAESALLHSCAVFIVSTHCIACLQSGSGQRVLPDAPSAKLLGGCRGRKKRSCDLACLSLAFLTVQVFLGPPNVHNTRRLQ